MIVETAAFDQRRLREWFIQRVNAMEADTWPRLAALLSRLGHWEFEDYRDR